MYHGTVYIYYRGVVPKPSAIPSAAAITIAVVSIAIINTAVETNLIAPVTHVETVSAVVKSPIGWCPIKTGIRWGNPYAGYPIITINIVISPVAWLP
jgi:hypothetical protein